MTSFSSIENIRVLKERLKAIDDNFEDFEVEELVLYSHVENRLKKAKVR